MSMTLTELHSLMETEAIEKKIPLSGDFEITPRCNLNCVMCYVRRHPSDKLAIEKEMSAEQIISIARQARDMGMLYILLTGGEILVRKDFKFIYEEINNLGLVITLYTNGTLITQEWVDWIAKMPPRKVSITMYGASADTYEKVSGSREAFQRVDHAIDMLLEKGIKVELKTTWIKSSVDDYYRLYEFAESKGLQLKIVNYVFPSSENQYSNPLGHRLDPEVLSKKEVEIELHALQQSIEHDSQVVSLESDEPVKKISQMKDGAFQCNAGVTGFWLSWRGDILPCGVMSEPKVIIEKNDFGKAWAKINESTTQVPGCESCSKCDARQYCLTCPARLYAENGSFEKPADYLCKHARSRMILMGK